MRAAITHSAAAPAHVRRPGGAGSARPVPPRARRPGAAPSGPLRAAIAAALLAAAAAALAAPAGTAAAAPPDPATTGAPVAVMGLSLSMTAHQVAAVLHRQALRLHIQSDTCAAAPAKACTDLIRARTPDGWLSVRLAEDPAHAAGTTLAWRIRLTIDGSARAAPARPREFGNRP